MEIRSNFNINFYKKTLQVQSTTDSVYTCINIGEMEDELIHKLTHLKIKSLISTLNKSALKCHTEQRRIQSSWFLAARKCQSQSHYVLPEV